MGFRFRKSVNLGGVRFTASKSGVSTSIGGKGFRVTKHANGKISSTASIPGTGISYTSNLSSSSRSSRQKASGNSQLQMEHDNFEFPSEPDNHGSLNEMDNHDLPKAKPGCSSIFLSIFFFCFMIMSGTFKQPHIALIAFLICFILTLPIPALFAFWERIKLTKNWRIGLVCLVFFLGGGLASMDTDQSVSAVSANSSVSTVSSSQSLAASSTSAAVPSSTQAAVESSSIVTSSSIPSASSSEVALSVSSEATVLPVSSSAAPPETSPESVSTPEEEEKTMVWIAGTGTKYHRKSTCSNMESPQQIELEQAISWGYEACKRCY